MAQTFYCCNLGIRIAVRGLNFALLDFETRLPTAAFMFGECAGEPAIADILHAPASGGRGLHEVCEENHILLDDRSVLKLVSLEPGALDVLREEPVDAALAGSFRRLLFDVDLAFINLPEQLVESPLLPELAVQQFLFIVGPGLEDVMQTFELIRKVSKSLPPAALGVLIHGAADITHVRSAFASLSRAVRKDPGADLRFVGQFPRSPLMAESLLSRSPIALDKTLREANRRLDTIASSVLRWVAPEHEHIGVNEAVAL
jgi:MinD-like ATPase involved in chromosome partitioning or flagellar assembly